MIVPRDLFSRDILNYQVETSGYGLTRFVNLDNAATTPPLLAVQEAVNQFFNGYGSVHRGAGAKSKRSTELYERSKDEIRAYLNAPSGSYVLFTGNTTGAMNAAARLFSRRRGQVAVSEIEHSSSSLPWLREEVGSVLRYLVSDTLDLDLASIEKLLITRRVKLLVVTASSNLTGQVASVGDIGRMALTHQTPMLLDACQYLQHHPLDMQSSESSFVAASGHKFYAPFGGGFLVGPSSFFDEVEPYQIGGGNLPYISSDGSYIRSFNERAHDAGTPNAVGAVAMAAALRELRRIGLDTIERYESRLTACAYEALSAIPQVKLFTTRERLTSIIPFTIEGIHYQQVAERLNAEFGIGVRAGSFCMYGALRRLFQIRDDRPMVEHARAGRLELLPGLVRASFGLSNTVEDVERFVDAISAICRHPSKPAGRAPHQSSLSQSISG